MTREPTITRNTSAGGRQEDRGPDSKISQKTFVGTLGAALTVLMLMLFATVSMNAVTAAFSPGIGGINASFGELNYDNNTAGSPHGDAHIYPTTSFDTAACPGGADASAGKVPVLTADIPGTVNVTGLTLNKSIPTTGTAFNVMTGIDNITISIEAAQNSFINLDAPVLKFSGLNASWLNLSGGVRIYENFSNGTNAHPYLGPDGEFHVNATNVRMKNAVAYAHLIGFQSINLPDQELSLVFNYPNAEISDDSCNL